MNKNKSLCDCEQFIIFNIYFVMLDYEIIMQNANMFLFSSEVS